MSQPKKDDAKPTLFGFDMLARLNSLAVRDGVGFIVFLISTLGCKQHRVRVPDTFHLLETSCKALHICFERNKQVHRGSNVV